MTRLESELALDSIQTPDGDGRADLEADETDADSVVSEPTRIVSRVGDASRTSEVKHLPAIPLILAVSSVETETTRTSRVESESEADDRSDDTDPTPVASAVDDEPENEPPRGSDDPDSNESADSDARTRAASVGRLADATGISTEDCRSESAAAGKRQPFVWVATRR